ncbi:hypothetical protein T439DRAFT_381445 [Meredithblackwellia eburnea MCA 4105]
MADEQADKNLATPKPSLEALERLLQLKLWQFNSSYWLAIQPLLIEKGYKLLTQLEDDLLQIETGSYAPEFVSSDDAAGRVVRYYDQQNVVNGRLVADDGKRPTLKTPLVFKLVDTAESKEIEMLQFFQKGESKIREHPWNRTIPYVDSFALSPTRSILVMEEWGGKFLELEKLEEFEYFVQMMLETISFIHEHGVAHCDIAEGNITMGPLSYFDNHLEVSYELPRGEKPPFMPKYVLLDFQLSERRPATETGPFLMKREHAGQLRPPENSSTKEYDLFAGDVYSLGRTIKGVSADAFEDCRDPERKNISDYLQPLWDRMTDVDPNKRPTAREALDIFKNMRRTQDPPKPLYTESSIARGIAALSLDGETSSSAGAPTLQEVKQ